MIFSNDSRSDHNLLRHIAQSSGGQYFNLVKLNNSDVANAIGKTHYSYQSSTHQQDKISDLLPLPAQSFGEHFVFSGKLNSPKASLTLNFKTADNKIESTTYQLSLIHI